MSPTTTWPELSVESWAETRESLHLWLQIVGKVQLDSTPLENHWWNVTYQLSARGLRTHLLQPAGHSVDVEFDLIDHELVLRSADGGRQQVALEPRSVADFYAAVTEAVTALGLTVQIDARPNEVSPAIPFAQDTTHRAYDPAAVTTYWRQLLAVNRVFERWRAGFAGKQSPSQLFWGSMDLSCVRFSGRTAPEWSGTPPPNCPAWVMVEAESRENASAGFWSGGEEGLFYAYALPAPEGYSSGSVSVGHYDEQAGEWVLPYKQVRTSDDPEQTLLTFLDETYALAADLGRWDRASLDVDPHRLDTELGSRQ